jgi:hypothetical protein
MDKFVQMLRMDQEREQRLKIQLIANLTVTCRSMTYLTMLS